MNAGQIEQFGHSGYLVVPALFAEAEVAGYKAHYMHLRICGTYPGDMWTPDPGNDDPLKRFPRMIHMHRWDDRSRHWLLDSRLRRCLSGLLGQDPYAVQTMLYFKPPGARGQALHQDQHFLRVEPGTCVAAWLALDDADEENGCMQVVPGSHRLPLLCTREADSDQSFTDVEVQMPEDMDTVPVPMQAGDVLFFHGHLIHGSFPNTSRDRYRRSLIGHYIMAEAEKIEPFYHPVLTMDGDRIEFGSSLHGGPCGVWVERNGLPHVEMREDEKA
jgi:phytanoyl-CoA hydroxylase